MSYFIFYIQIYTKGEYHMLEIHDLTKKFHQHTVLDHLNMIVHKGDLIYIHGINGSGKSTLFKLICDILEPDNGCIILSEQAHIGALIENPGFLERETGVYNLKFLAHLNHHFYEDKIMQLCNDFQLDIQSHTKVKDYSLGMRQKLGIIQALMEDQNFILLDEPTRGLDEDSVKAFCHLINDLHNQNKTIIIAAHEYLREIHYNKILHLKNGLLIEDEVL